ncbi:MAG: DUF1127 domain-containing protein [Ahrensia sp.]|nr:DUF1127 domain-containing protein [Ahrensia sp.]
MNIKRSFQAWRESRAIYNELSSLSVRELRDMGISQADIPRIARMSVKDRK